MRLEEWTLLNDPVERQGSASHHSFCGGVRRLKVGHGEHDERSADFLRDGRGWKLKDAGESCGESGPGCNGPE